MQQADPPPEARAASITDMAWLDAATMIWPAYSF